MGIEATIETLNRLIQLGFDAARAYQQAIDRLDAAAIGAQLTLFQRDHERHVVELAQAVRDVGGEALEPGRAVKGTVVEGVTALRSLTGAAGALHAVQGREEDAGRRYDEALAAELPDGVRELLGRHRDDQRRHLAYVERTLTNLDAAEAPRPDAP